MGSTHLLTNVGEDLVLVAEDTQDMVSPFCIGTSKSIQMETCGILDLQLL
jgi:hypothetical protein